MPPMTVRLAEIAEILGVSHQRASQLADEPGFPAPIVAAPRRRRWAKRDVEAVAWREAVAIVSVTPVTLRGVHHSSVLALEVAVRFLTDLMIPTTTNTAPVGTRMKAVHQTARPTPIANSPQVSHGQATFTEEGYPVGRIASRMDAWRR